LRKFLDVSRRPRKRNVSRELLQVQLAVDDQVIGAIAERVGPHGLADCGAGELRGELL
jgi:hypothetical protein